MLSTLFINSSCSITSMVLLKSFSRQSSVITVILAVLSWSTHFWTILAKLILLSAQIVPILPITPLLFLALILRLFYLAERQKSTFGRVYGYCVACIFLFHVMINIGMVTGLTPVIGIPLPFFSYGGSSLWGFTILLFIFLRIDMARKRR